MDPLASNLAVTLRFWYPWTRVLETYTENELFVGFFQQVWICVKFNVRCDNSSAVQYKNVARFVRANRQIRVSVGLNQGNRY